MKFDPEHALQRLHQAAEQAGLRCLTKTWRTWEARYELICEKGHQFTRVGSGIVFHSAVCLECLNQERLARLHQAAQARGGKCLESTYLGSDVPHRIECAHGHQWTTQPSRIIAESSWCSRCAAAEHGQRIRRQDGLEQLQRIAAEKGGVCLSDVYTVGKVHYRFQCAQGHQWETVGDDIVRGSWCLQCSYDAKRQNYLLADGLERLQKRAREHGGECLDQVYIGSNAYYRFRCGNGHEWKTTGNRIVRGAWCAQCLHDSKKLGIEVMRQIARERGGKCLSEHYVNSATKLHWECHLGHRWYAIPGAIRKGHWCAACGHLSRIRNPKSKARTKYQASPRTVIEAVREA